MTKAVLLGLFVAILFNQGQAAVCGNGVREAGEECDQGGSNSNTVANKCREDCTNPRCGDGVVDYLETCDDGGFVNGDGCDDACAKETGYKCVGQPSSCSEICGDGFTIGAEQCDTAATDYSGECTMDCINAECGDGHLWVGVEECDSGPFMSDTTPDACRPGCLNPWCGDGVQDSGEECDDGNADNSDGCLDTCEVATCGDGFLQSGTEECDNGAANSDIVPDACRADCVLPSCGDGTRDSGEECDSGAANSDTAPNACRAACVNPSCGDGVVDFAEQCDAGPSNSDVDVDACRTSCRHASCGDGVVDAGEECDDGAGNSDTIANACRTTCALAGCGDGIIDDEEECDDGVFANADGCSKLCAVEDGWTCDAAEPTVCTGATCTTPVLSEGMVVLSGCVDDGALFSTCTLYCEGGYRVVGPVDAPCSPHPGLPTAAYDVGLTCTNIDDCTVGGEDVCKNGGECTDKIQGFECACSTGYMQPKCETALCGDGLMASTLEGCDDGNKIDGDGCSAACIVESGWVCNGDAPSLCSEKCGDGVVDIGEECDDGAKVSGNGCSSTCGVEDGWTCSGEPSVCVASTCAAPVLSQGVAVALGCDDMGALDTACTLECSSGYETGRSSGTCTPAIGGAEAAYAVSLTCTDKDECLLVASCDSLATCTNTEGSYSCVCPAGYAGDGSACTDVDECADGSHACDALATCTNSPGSYSCSCPSGLLGDGASCTDIDECEAGLANCASDATCTNTAGSFTCSCPDGFLGDGMTCTVCPCNGGTCEGTSISSFTCTSCPSGTFGVLCGNTCTHSECVGQVECSDSGQPISCSACKPGYVAPSCALATCPEGSSVIGPNCNCDLDGYSGTPVWDGSAWTPCTKLPTCGDGVLEDGEACDDGGLVGGDGCSASCVVEDGWECSGPSVQPTVCIVFTGDNPSSTVVLTDDEAASSDWWWVILLLVLLCCCLCCLLAAALLYRRNKREEEDAETASPAERKVSFADLNKIPQSEYKADFVSFDGTDTPGSVASVGAISIYNETSADDSTARKMSFSSGDSGETGSLNSYDYDGEYYGHGRGFVHEGTTRVYEPTSPGGHWTSSSDEDKENTDVNTPLSKKKKKKKKDNVVRRGVLVRGEGRNTPVRGFRWTPHKK